jgi:hypothetical protein
MAVSIWAASYWPFYIAPQNLRTGAIMSKVASNIVIIGGTLIVLAWALKNLKTHWN